MTDPRWSNGVKKEEERDEEAEVDDLFFGSDDESEDDFVDTPNDVRDGMNFGERLKPHRPSTYTCDHLVRMIESGIIDLEAEYQREAVWKPIQQSHLIDSIYRHCYIPPILFSVKSIVNEDGDTEEVKVCVDGKQRLTSIKNFLQNKIPMLEPQTNRRFWYRPNPSQKKQGISQARRDAFSYIQINCCEYDALSEETERDMFRRVQQGIQLSPGENLAAERGPWPDFCRELVKRFFDGKKYVGIIDLSRGRDYLFVGYICLLYLNRAKRKYIPTSVTLKSFFQNPELAPTDTQRKEIIAALTRWSAMANDPLYNTNLMFTKGATGRKRPLAPVEFVFTVYILFQFSLATNDDLSNMFGEMRRVIRAEHKDVMHNGTVEATIRKFLFTMEENHPSWLTPLPSSNSRKRTREEEEDGEFLPTGDEYVRRRINA